ncbi:hypothetical protein DYB32_001128 [Aphanomyces invadans]|uniref:deoxyribose-phosphate aldolase n=1 Tax=Aphanomyces invadans TaxID=157072 RepID=A0A3R6ZW08_9STRA|nr:hypothetical protein DYB32_001128 [Aphanomyces invadans]
MECKHCKDIVSKSVHLHAQNCPSFDGCLPAGTLATDNSNAVKAESDAIYHPLSRLIDHTFLKADATPDSIVVLCKEAVENGFMSVCVNGMYASYARRSTCPRHVKVCCVVGFPLGASSTAVKAFETTQCLDDGAEEIDMVIAIGKLKAGDHAYVLRDICAVVTVCKAKRALCKVIFETALLTETEIETASHLAVAAGADFIKTSTGFSSRGASIDDVTTMSRIAHPRNVHVKASGGIRTLEDAHKMVAAGATRLGTSGGVAITHGNDVAVGQY